ncbi:hypothetical protein HJG43_03800 [Kineosporiaceae bacterium SCSIO 59966]|nr:hypothetical protein HJG43_03800 [Kineosporiaceae bacterium SCSIO 59966]
MSQPPAPVRRPPLQVAVVALVALEAGMLLGVAVFYVVGIARGAASDVVVAAFTAALAVVVGGALGVFARGLWGGRRWSRAPVVTWNLLVGFSVLSSGGWRTPVGLGVLVVAVVVLVAVLSPTVTRATSSAANPPVT